MSFACYLGGNAVRFSAARFSGDLGYVFRKVRPEDVFSDIVGENLRVRTCTGNVLSGVVVDFYVERVYSFRLKNPAAKSSLLLSFAIFEFSFSKGRRCTEFCGEDFGSILVRFSRLGVLVGV